MNTTENYLLRKWKSTDESKSLFDIEQKDLIYSQLGETHHGLQCNHIGETEEHKEIMELCIIITNSIKRIDEINKK